MGGKVDGVLFGEGTAHHLAGGIGVPRRPELQERLGGNERNWTRELPGK